MNFKPGMNILTSSCCKTRAPPTSGVGGANERIDRVRNSPFYASLWRLTARDRRLAVVSNVGSVKYKAQTASKRSGKPRALEALEFEKWQKIAFCAKWSLFSYPTTYESNASLLPADQIACHKV